jgi:hypothetical protein
MVAYNQQSITVAVALEGRIEFGECVNFRTEETCRADVRNAVKAKADRDSSAVDGLLAGVWPSGRTTQAWHALASQALGATSRP